MIQKIRNQNKEMTDTVGLDSVSSSYSGLNLERKLNPCLQTDRLIVLVCL